MNPAVIWGFLAKLLPQGEDGRAQGSKDWAQVFFISFGCIALILMLGGHFDPVQVTEGVTIDIKRAVPWYHFAGLSIVFYLLTNLSRNRRDEIRRRTGTGPGGEQSKPPDEVR